MSTLDDQFILALIELGIITIAAGAVVWLVYAMTRHRTAEYIADAMAARIELSRSRPPEILDLETALGPLKLSDLQNKQAAERYFESYFAAIFREYHMARSGAASGPLWSIWHNDTRKKMSIRLYQESWGRDWRALYATDQDFVYWVDGLILGRRPYAPHYSHGRSKTVIVEKTRAGTVPR